MATLDEVVDALARIETKLDFHKESLDKHEGKIRDLEIKWWGSLGGVFVIVGTWVKSLFNA